MKPVAGIHLIFHFCLRPLFIYMDIMVNLCKKVTPVLEVVFHFILCFHNQGRIQQHRFFSQPLFCKPVEYPSYLRAVKGILGEIVEKLPGDTEKAGIGFLFVKGFHFISQGGLVFGLFLEDYPVFHQIHFSFFPIQKTGGIAALQQDQGKGKYQQDMAGDPLSYPKLYVLQR